MRRAWRALLPVGLRRQAQPLLGVWATARVRGAIRRSPVSAAPGPLVVSGLINETKGVSEGARLTLAGLRAGGLSVVGHDLREVLGAGPGGRARLPQTTPGGIWLIHANAPEAIRALAYLDPAEWLSRRRIGYWAYELPRLPADWARAAPAFDEIWVPSRFVADAARAAGVATPVRVMPHPVAEGFAAGRADRARFGLNEGVFTVLAMGDVASSVTRKNLDGAAAIYRAAFPADDGRSRLVLKVQGASDDPQFAALARAMTAGRSDVTIIAETLETQAMRDLMASCDVLLSPHRAEGFGLAPAEAFLSGLPALATGWSGNLDFMSGMDELLIAHRLVPVRDASGVYRQAGQSWAEPDIADAAAKLQRLAQDSDLRDRLAQAGSARVKALSDVWSRENLLSALGPWLDEDALTRA